MVNFLAWSDQSGMSIVISCHTVDFSSFTKMQTLIVEETKLKGVSSLPLHLILSLWSVKKDEVPKFDPMKHPAYLRPILVKYEYFDRCLAGWMHYRLCGQ